MADRENIIKKIRALLDKAESTNYEAEADTFYAKAQELMLQYAVDEAEMEAAGTKKDEQIVIRKVYVKEGYPATQSRQYFLSQIAKSFGCRVFLYSGTDHTAVVGYESDTMFVELLYLSVNIQCYSVLQREVKAQKDWYRLAEMKFKEAAFRRAFTFGYFDRVAERVKERYECKLESVGESTAIVLRNKGDVVEDWLNSRMELVSTKKSTRKQYDFAAQGRGRVEGESANIGVGDKAVGSSPELPA